MTQAWQVWREEKATVAEQLAAGRPFTENLNRWDL